MTLFLVFDILYNNIYCHATRREGDWSFDKENVWKYKGRETLRLETVTMEGRPTGDPVDTKDSSCTTNIRDHFPFHRVSGCCLRC